MTSSPNSSVIKKLSGHSHVRALLEGFVHRMPFLLSAERIRVLFNLYWACALNESRKCQSSGIGLQQWNEETVPVQIGVKSRPMKTVVTSVRYGLEGSHNGRSLIITNTPYTKNCFI